MLKIRLSGQDSSLYVIPSARAGDWRFGVGSIPAGRRKATIRTDRQCRHRDKPPHLSIHATGVIHAYVGDQRTVDLSIPKLRTLRGEHVLTYFPDDLAACPDWTGTPKTKGRNVDLVVRFTERVRGARIVLYVNGTRPRFHGGRVPTGWRFEVPDPRGAPIHVGLLCVPQPRIAKRGTPPGTNIVTGWDPTAARPDRDVQFLWIRGSPLVGQSRLRRLGRAARDAIRRIARGRLGPPDQA